MNQFGQRVRELRLARGMSLRDLAPLVGVGYTYLSKVENGRLDFGDYPSDALIHRLADSLKADEDELLLLAERIPDDIKKRVLQRPDAFRMLARCDDATLDKVIGKLGPTKSRRKTGKDGTMRT